MAFKEFLSAFLILFSVIDIIGTFPIIIDLKEKGFEVESSKASFASLVIMLAFLFTGEQVLRLFGVDVESFAVAGSIILFLLAIEMILGVHLFKEDKKTKKGSIVPIAFPLVAGAGTMTTIISIKAKFSDLVIISAIALNCLVVFFVLWGSDWLKTRISPGFIAVLRKMFGIILLATAVKLFRDNFHLYIKT